jgi:phosphoribosylanthranilate isomerase
MMKFFSAEQTSLKICGVRTAADAHGLAELGVDALGVNFWPHSKRYLDPQEADWLKDLKGKILRVGVFVNQPAELSIRLISEGMIDVVQLHGDETAEDVAFFSKEGISVIKALGVKTEEDIAKAGEFEADAILLDAHAPIVFGGTGETFDWGLAMGFKKQYPSSSLVLAGGITPLNVADAIRMIRPAAIDIASGAELSPGVKDFIKVQQLLEACRQGL